MKLKLTGLQNVERQVQRRIAAVEETTPRAVADVALDLLSESVTRAPVDQGPLRGSGSARLGKKVIAEGYDEDGRAGIRGTGASLATGTITGRDIDAEVRFEAEYALEQHERLDFDHPKGGQAKYLEDPLTENADRYLRHLRGALTKAVTDGTP